MPNEQAYAAVKCIRWEVALVPQDISDKARLRELEEDRIDDDWPDLRIAQKKSVRSHLPGTGPPGASHK